MNHNRLQNLTIPAVLIGLIAVGCKDASPNLVGSYTGKPEMPASMLNDRVKSLAASQFLNQKPMLELNADKSFTMFIGAEMKGTWSLSGGKIRMQMESIAGRTIEDEIKRTKLVNPGLNEEKVRRQAKEETFLMLGYSSDYKTVTFEDQKTPGVKVIFTRKSGV